MPVCIIPPQYKRSSAQDFKIALFIFVFIILFVWPSFGQIFVVCLHVSGTLQPHIQVMEIAHFTYFSGAQARKMNKKEKKSYNPFLQGGDSLKERRKIIQLTKPLQ